jgi:hypothetical protein
MIHVGPNPTEYSVHLRYSHPPIKNKAWVTRREQEVVKIVGKCLTFALVGREAKWYTTLDVAVKIGWEETVADICVPNLTKESGIRLVEMLNSNKNVDATLYFSTNGDTIRIWPVATAPQPPVPAVQAIC